MKTVVSYSCGKDSTLVLHRLIKEKHEIVAIMVTINEDMERSWFHGVNKPLLYAISDSLGIALIECKTKGEVYHLSFEEHLLKAKELGAVACAFGDIDIDAHRTWCSDRCTNTGLQALFPLWQEDRESIVREFISLGYEAVIKCINNTQLDEDVLGKVLSLEMLDYFKEKKIDACGENGEYHTVVLGGEIFKKPISYKLGDTFKHETLSAVDIVLN